jgi:hypothetical protein
MKASTSATSGAMSKKAEPFVYRFNSFIIIP